MRKDHRIKPRELSYGKKLLRKLRKERGMGRIELAKKINCPPQYISMMEVDTKKPIGELTARKFQDVFNVDYRLFMAK